MQSVLAKQPTHWLLAGLQTGPPALPTQCVLLTHSTQRIVAGLHALVVAVLAQSATDVQLMTHVPLPCALSTQTCPVGQWESIVHCRQVLFIVLQWGVVPMHVESSIHATQVPL